MNGSKVLQIFRALFDFRLMDHGREQKIIKDFGERLKKIRTEKKLSTRALADLAEMDFGNINEIENGKINPSLTTIVLLAEALQIEPADLLSKKKGQIQTETLPYNHIISFFQSNLYLCITMKKRMSYCCSFCLSSLEDTRRPII
jgi:transcriptional regulator with XRE-family HTH domain